MNENQTTVADVYRRAMAIKKANPSITYKEIKSQIISEFEGKPFPPVNRLTIPEQDALVPEEDWTAGLPIVLRGIQTENWTEIAHGIMISLEQVENFQQHSGSEQSKAWHNRTRGIQDQTQKGLDKWLPEDLMKIAEKSQKR